MKNGIGKGKTREDHANVSDQVYAAYANGRSVRDLVAVIGEESLGDLDKLYLKFAEKFENLFVRQGKEDNRMIEETLSTAWDFLGDLPESELKRISAEFIEKFHPKRNSEASKKKVKDVSVSDYADPTSSTGATLKGIPKKKKEKKIV